MYFYLGKFDVYSERESVFILVHCHQAYSRSPIVIAWVDGPPPLEIRSCEIRDKAL